jgi:hypothetical protein
MRKCVGISPFFFARFCIKELLQWVFPHRESQNGSFAVPYGEYKLNRTDVGKKRNINIIVAAGIEKPFVRIKIADIVQISKSTLYDHNACKISM